MKKERLDALLTARGLFESRARAQAAIMAGQVLVNEQKIDKTGDTGSRRGSDTPAGRKT